jgi:8-oxo-dGTP pyrophosphatase MutT (NUDIX family)
MPLGWPESRSGWLGHVLDDLLLLVGRYGVASTEIGAWLFNIPRRLTAFACAVDPEGRVLMVQHERLGVVRWELPGGHVDPGEPVAAAAERETAEETGLAVVATQVIAEAVHRWHGNEVGIVYFRAEPVHSEHAVSRVPRTCDSSRRVARPRGLDRKLDVSAGVSGHQAFRQRKRQSPAVLRRHPSQDS